MTTNMWNEDLRQIGDVPASRILEAVEKARDAFWDSIAESFPEVTTGDMGPGDDTELEWGSNSAVSIWLMYNHPSSRGEDDDLIDAVAFTPNA